MPNGEETPDTMMIQIGTLEKNPLENRLPKFSTAALPYSLPMWCEGSLGSLELWDDLAEFSADLLLIVSGALNQLNLEKISCQQWELSSDQIGVTGGYTHLCLESLIDRAVRLVGIAGI